MDIHVSGSRPTRRAPAETFTGTVLQDPIITTNRRHDWSATASPSSRAHAPPGTPIRWARRCT